MPGTFHDYFAFDKEHLACLKQHIAVKSIEKNLNKLKLLKKTCPDCNDPFPDASDFLRLADKNYLALSIKKQPFGGYNVFVLFKNEPQAYRLWLYPIDDGEFQLREIKIREFSKKVTRQMLVYAKERQYSKYWRIVRSQ